ncbi:hypothetical protein M5E87_27895 [Flavonifractor plautii]|nr:hypothetical protein M5E87_27895 [Flavonifractor plautii]
MARRRLIFEELFCLACGMALLRTGRTCAEGVPFPHRRWRNSWPCCPSPSRPPSGGPWRRWRPIPPPARP